MKLTAAQVNAVVERTNAADRYYKMLVLLNGIPVTGTHFEQQNPQKIKDIKVLKTQEEIRTYTEADLNAILLITTGSWGA